MAGTITIRLNDTEDEALNSFTALYGISKSSLLKKLAFEKLEEEYDILLARQAYKDYMDSGKKATPAVDFRRRSDEEV